MQSPVLARRILAAAAAASLFVACAHAAPFAYVPSPNNQVNVVDTATNRLTTTLPTGANPHGVAVSPAGHRVYVSNFDDGTVTVIDSLNVRVLGTVAVGQQPLGLEVSPDGTKVAVATFGTNSLPSHSIAIIDVASGQVSPIAVDAGPTSVAYDPSGSRLYSANFVDHTVSIIDAPSSSPAGNIGVPANPFGLAMNPASPRLYVEHLADTSGAQSLVSVINTSSAQLIATIPLSGDPQWLAVSPDGQRLYVAIGASGTVAVIDTATNRVLFEFILDALSFPSGVAVSSDNARVFVVDAGRSELSTYDASSFSKLSAVAVGNNPVAYGDFLGPDVLSSGADSPGPLSGIWFNPNESGWGINFTQRGTNVFAAWYTYDAAGNPKWYVAPNCTMAQSTCSGTLYQVTGPQFFGVAFDPSKRNVTAAGSASVNFTSNDTATFNYTVGSQSRSVAIQREQFATGPAPQVNYTDLWFNASEPGWGISLTQQASIVFGAWYVYDDSGNPVWYVLPNCPMNSTGDSCAGDVFRTTGPPLGPTFDPTQVQVFPAGRMIINFTDPNNATLNYLFDSLFVTKKITRELF